MADYPNHSAHDDNVTMAPPDLSLLSAALPSVLRQRLASFRKSMLVGDLDGVYTASKSSKDCVYASESTLVPDGTGEKQGQIRVIEDELSRPSTSSSFSPITPEPRTPIDYGMVATAEDVNDSGVSWNRVSPGFNLLQNATYEVQRSRPDNSLARSLFINGVLYLLEALPNDLSAEEISVIRARLPLGIERTIPICTRACQDNTCNDTVHGKPERSLLHRVLATSIIQIFMVIHFLIPYLKVLLQCLYKYERAHRISERMLAISIDTVDNLGKGGSRIGSAASRLGDGDVGNRIQNIAVWGLEETVRGVSEGVGEGLAILGVVGPGAKHGAGTVPR